MSLPARHWTNRAFVLSAVDTLTCMGNKGETLCLMGEHDSGEHTSNPLLPVMWLHLVYPDRLLVVDGSNNGLLVNYKQLVVISQLQASL